MKMNKLQKLYRIITELNTNQLSLPQFLCLAQIAHNFSITSRQLADFLEVTPAAITPNIDALEKSGYVERTRCKIDRRKIFLGATKEGLEQLTKWENDIHSITGYVYE